MPVHWHILLHFLIFVACKDTAWKLTELYVMFEPLDGYGRAFSESGFEEQMVPRSNEIAIITPSNNGRSLFREMMIDANHLHYLRR